MLLLCPSAYRRASWLLLALTIAGLLPLLIALDRTPIPWTDEVLWASTSVSLMKGHPAAPAILGAFPETGRFDLFYGPVGFRLGSIWMRYMGVSATSWRMLSFLGGLLTVVLGGLLIIGLGGSWELAAIAMFLIGLSPSIGQRINSGRLDTVTAALELGALLSFILGMRRNTPYTVLSWVAGGLALAMAVLSTPRALPFCMAVAFATIVLLIVSWRKPIAIGFALSAAVVLAVTSAWTYSQGLNPLSWLNYIRTVSHGDTGNVSPLLGGAWNAGYAVYPPELLTPIVIVIIASGLLWSWTKIRKTSRERSPYFDPIVFVGVTGGINMLLTFALLSRALDYEVFYVFPVLVVLLILSMHLSRVPCCIGAKRVVLMSLVFLAAISLGIRGLKLLEVYQSWSARNPEMISSFVKTNVPVDAIVFGEEACYYWAVYQSGSKYLWLDERTTPGLASHSVSARDQLLHPSASAPVYLLWRRGSALPTTLAPNNLRLVASFEAPVATSPLFRQIRRWIGWGYPNSDLYLVESSR
jgi:hypothetical protein